MTGGGWRPPCDGLRGDHGEKLDNVDSCRAGWSAGVGEGRRLICGLLWRTVQRRGCRSVVAARGYHFIEIMAARCPVGVASRSHFARDSLRGRRYLPGRPEMPIRRSHGDPSSRPCTNDSRQPWASGLITPSTRRAAGGPYRYRTTRVEDKLGPGWKAPLTICSVASRLAPIHAVG